MWETIRGYLTFTRKERYGVLFLLILVFVFFVLPFFLKQSPGDKDPASYPRMKDEIRKFESGSSDSSDESADPGRYVQKKVLSSEAYTINDEINRQKRMFYF